MDDLIKCLYEFALENNLLMLETFAQNSIEREYLFRAALELAGELKALAG